MNKANSLSKAILLTGLFACTLDATAAIFNFIILFKGHFIHPGILLLPAYKQII